MRFFLYLIFSISINLMVFTNAVAVIPLSDVSAGVFRFQAKLAEQGNPEAQYKVGEMYETGQGAAKNIQKALTWFEKAAKQGHKKSIYKLLFLEIKSNGLNDFTKSQLGMLRQEAATGNTDAQYFLGKMYAAGVGVPKSLNNALTWLNKAVFNGIIEAEKEAVVVEKELARIRKNEANKRAVALAAAKKRRTAENKNAENKQRAQRVNQSKKGALVKKNLEERNRIEEERRALAEEKRKLEKERQFLDAERDRAASQAAEKEEKSSFVSDPCKGKSARFLSTCR